MLSGRDTNCPLLDRGVEGVVYSQQIETRLKKELYLNYGTGFLVGKVGGNLDKAYLQQ